MRKLDFISKLKEIHPQLLPIGSTSLKNEHIEILCRDCGNIFHAKRDEIFERKTCCPTCKYKRNNKKKIKEVLSKNNLELIKIINTEESEVKCKICGDIQRFKNENILEHKIKCRFCHSELMLKRKEAFTETCRNICFDNNLEFVKISDDLRDIEYLCNTCNEPQSMRLRNFLEATRYCKKCGYDNLRLTQEQYKDKISERFELVGKYKGMESEVKVKCKQCGKEVDDKAIKFAWNKKVCCYK